MFRGLRNEGERLAAAYVRGVWYTKDIQVVEDTWGVGVQSGETWQILNST
jgi:hypothetical protein